MAASSREILLRYRTRTVDYESFKWCNAYMVETYAMLELAQGSRQLITNSSHVAVGQWPVSALS